MMIAVTISGASEGRRSGVDSAGCRRTPPRQRTLAAGHYRGGPVTDITGKMVKWGRISTDTLIEDCLVWVTR